MKRIIITVGPAGEVSIQTRGYVGKSCKAASKPFEDALGVRTGETITPEYHQAEPARNRNDAKS